MEFDYLKVLTTIVEAYRYGKTGVLPQHVENAIKEEVRKEGDSAYDLDAERRINFASIYMTHEINMRILTQLIVGFNIIEMFESSYKGYMKYDDVSIDIVDIETKGL